MNMYVSNLSFHTGDDDLKKLFEQFGAVSSAKVINDRETGGTRGFVCGRRFTLVNMMAEDKVNVAVRGPGD